MQLSSCLVKLPDLKAQSINVFEAGGVCTCHTLSDHCQHIVTFHNFIYHSFSVYANHHILISSEYQATLSSTLSSDTYFRGDLDMKTILPLTLFQELLAKEWTLRTDKLPPGSLPRDSVARISECAQYDLKYVEMAIKPQQNNKNTMYG